MAAPHGTHHPRHQARQPPRRGPGSPGLGLPPALDRVRLARPRVPRRLLGYLAARRPRPRPRPAGERRALPDPLRPPGPLPRGRPRDGPAAQELLRRTIGRAHRRQLAHGHSLDRADELRDDRLPRLPARRRLAPPLRPGRDPLGPDAPDDDLRGRAVDPGARHAADRGRARVRCAAHHGPGLASALAARAEPRRDAHRRVAARRRVGLGHPAVPHDLAPADPRRRRWPWPRVRPPLGRTRWSPGAAAFYAVAASW